MTVKVQRGLGLLVVALIAFLISYAASEGSGPSAFSDLFGMAAVLVGLSGLVLLAVGLLRD